MTKLISACIIVAKEEPFIHLTLQSLLGVADEVILVGDPDEKTIERIESVKRYADYETVLIARKWDGNYGAARTLAKNMANGKFCLQIDSDEILSENGFKLRELAKSENVDPIYCLQYQHFIHHFGLLDDTFNPHVGLGRFFRNIPEIKYPRALHEFAQHPEHSNPKLIEKVVLWHLGYVKSKADIRKKFEMNIEKSPVHSQDYLKWWYKSHMMGMYPVRQIIKEDVDNFPACLKRWLNLI